MGRWKKRKAVVRDKGCLCKIVPVYECLGCGSVFSLKGMQPNATTCLTCHLSREEPDDG